MRLERSDGIYRAVTTYDERELPKAAGFRWDPQERVWWTRDPRRAAKLARFARPELRAELEELANQTRQALAASRAPSASVAIPAPEGLEYLPFQKAGIAYALARPATLIADEMGLGKTIQAIGVINADPSVCSVLVVCPASLRINWRRELERWLCRSLTVGVVSSGKGPVPDTNIVIVNWDLLWTLRAQLRARSWDLIVADEAHFAKNPKAQRTRGLVGSRARSGAEPALVARRKLALTGTPLLNRPVELWPILHWLDPINWSNFWSFAKRYCAAWQHAWGWDLTGASNIEELQERLRSTVMVRRRKEEVLAELPPKRRQILELLPNGAAAVLQEEQRVLAAQEARLAELRHRTALAKMVFTEISRVRHRTALAKVPAVVEHVASLLEGGVDKVVVFAHHHDVINQLASGLAPYQPVRLMGSDAPQDRQAAVDRFQSDPTCRVFIGSIQAAGVGVTLTASKTVVFAELDWVPANMSQAEDRCHRIGQPDQVLVQHLVLEGSIDAHLARVLADKQRILDGVLDRCSVELAPRECPASPAREQDLLTTLRTLVELAQIKIGR